MRPKSTGGGLRRKILFPDKNSPGPGAYDISMTVDTLRNKSPSYTIKGKPPVTSLLDKNDPIIPGPG